MFSAFIETLKGSGDRDGLLQNNGTEKAVVVPNVEVQAHGLIPESPSIPPKPQRDVYNPSQSMQIRKPKMVADVDMPDCASFVDLVFEVHGEHHGKDLCSLELASKRGRSGSLVLSEEHYSPTLAEQHCRDLGRGQTGHGGGCRK